MTFDSRYIYDSSGIGWNGICHVAAMEILKGIFYVLQESPQISVHWNFALPLKACTEILPPPQFACTEILPPLFAPPLCRK